MGYQRTNELTEAGIILNFIEENHGDTLQDLRYSIIQIIQKSIEENTFHHIAQDVDKALSPYVHDTNQRQDMISIFRMLAIRLSNIADCDYVRYYKPKLREDVMDAVTYILYNEEVSLKYVNGTKEKIREYDKKRGTDPDQQVNRNIPTASMYHRIESLRDSFGVYDLSIYDIFVKDAIDLRKVGIHCMDERPSIGWTSGYDKHGHAICSKHDNTASHQPWSQRAEQHPEKNIRIGTQPNIAIPGQVPGLLMHVIEMLTHLDIPENTCIEICDYVIRSLFRGRVVKHTDDHHHGCGHITTMIPYMQDLLQGHPTLLSYYMSIIGGEKQNWSDASVSPYNTAEEILCGDHDAVAVINHGIFDTSASIATGLIHNTQQVYNTNEHGDSMYVKFFDIESEWVDVFQVKMAKKVYEYIIKQNDASFKMHILQKLYAYNPSTTDAAPINLYAQAIEKIHALKEKGISYGTWKREEKRMFIDALALALQHAATDQFTTTMNTLVVQHGPLQGTKVAHLPTPKISTTKNQIIIHSFDT